MSIERTTQLIKQNENIRLEFKEAARALPGNLFETICAMLNSKFFLQLGRVDELGSGVLNVNRFIKQYAGENLPQFIEGHIFKMLLPVANGENDHSNQDTELQKLTAFESLRDQVGTTLGLRWDQGGTKSALSRHQVGTKSAPSWHQVQYLLEFVGSPKPIQELMDKMDWKDRTKFRKKFILPLIELDILGMTSPEKARSSKQTYYLTENGKQFLIGLNS